MTALDGRAPTILTEWGARSLTDRIRKDLRGAIEGLVLAREGLAWEALGYPDWHTYVETEFGSLRDLALPVVERHALVDSMRTASPPVPMKAIAERLGVSAGTVHADAHRNDGPRLRIVPATPDYTGLSRTMETLARVRDQADRGLTSLELDDDTGWPMGTATGQLSRLERRGHVVRAADPARRRRNRAPYLVTESGVALLSE